MLENKPSKVFIKYVIPSVLGLVAISSASIVDGFFVGNYVGSLALAAINISFPILMILFGFALMFAVGNSVIISKLLGQKNLHEAKNQFSKAIVSIVLIAFFICGLILLNIETIFSLLNVKDELSDLTKEYLQITLFFMPFVMSGLLLDYMVRADENPNLAFFALFFSALLNVVLDYIFIVTLDFGLSGAAYATGISQGSILFILLFHFFSKKAELGFIKPSGSWSTILSACKNGFSEFVNESSAAITVLIFNFIMLKNFGAMGVASYTIIEYLIMLSVMISFGISDATQPIISKNLGANYIDRIKEFLKLAFSSIIVIEIIVVTLVLLVPDRIIDIFLDSSDLETKAITLEFIKYAWPAFLFLGVNILITSYLTAIGKPLPSALIASSRSLVFPVFFVVVLPMYFGQKGIFLALAFAEMFTFLLSITIYIRVYKKM